jgi:hypothetical protein
MYSVVLNEQYKIRQNKRPVEQTRFFKKTAASASVCEIEKLSGFERPQKTKIIEELNYRNELKYDYIDINETKYQMDWENMAILDSSRDD